MRDFILPRSSFAGQGRAWHEHGPDRHTGENRYPVSSPPGLRRDENHEVHRAAAARLAQALPRPHSTFKVILSLARPWHKPDPRHPDARHREAHHRRARHSSARLVVVCYIAEERCTVMKGQHMSTQMLVHNPMGYPPKVAGKALAPRLDTLKTSQGIPLDAQDWEMSIS